VANRLEIHTLGGLQILLASKPVQDLASRKANALVVYLSVMHGLHPREVLADLLWQDRNQARAMGNLRVILCSLRNELKDFLTIDRHSVSLNHNADVVIDTAMFDEHLDSGHLEDAVSLYKGDFLAGFSIRSARGFDHWALIHRELFRQQVIEALQRLIDFHVSSGAIRRGLFYATRLVELNPLMESAHRSLMSCLALIGQREAAFAQYESCSELLSKEIGLEMSDETQALLGRITSGKLQGAPASEGSLLRGIGLKPRTTQRPMEASRRRKQPNVSRQGAAGRRSTNGGSSFSLSPIP
jgi:DNA-binding SARP family transcriptional activator